MRGGRIDKEDLILWVDVIIAYYLLLDATPQESRVEQSFLHRRTLASVAHSFSGFLDHGVQDLQVELDGASRTIGSLLVGQRKGQTLLRVVDSHQHASQRSPEETHHFWTWLNYNQLVAYLLLLISVIIRTLPSHLPKMGRSMQTRALLEVKSNKIKHHLKASRRLMGELPFQRVLLCWYSYRSVKMVLRLRLTDGLLPSTLFFTCSSITDSISLWVLVFALEQVKKFWSAVLMVAWSSIFLADGCETSESFRLEGERD